METQEKYRQTVQDLSQTINDIEMLRQKSKKVQDEINAKITVLFNHIYGFMRKYIEENFIGTVLADRHNSEHFQLFFKPESVLDIRYIGYDDMYEITFKGDKRYVHENIEEGCLPSFDCIDKDEKIVFSLNTDMSDIINGVGLITMDGGQYKEADDGEYGIFMEKFNGLQKIRDKNGNPVSYMECVKFTYDGKERYGFAKKYNKEADTFIIQLKDIDSMYVKVPASDTEVTDFLNVTGQ